MLYKIKNYNMVNEEQQFQNISNHMDSYNEVLTTKSRDDSHIILSFGDKDNTELVVDTNLAKSFIASNLMVDLVKLLTPKNRISTEMIIKKMHEFIERCDLPKSINKDLIKVSLASIKINRARIPLNKKISMFFYYLDMARDLLGNDLSYKDKIEKVHEFIIYNDDIDNINDSKLSVYMNKILPGITEKKFNQILNGIYEQEFIQ